MSEKSPFNKPAPDAIDLLLSRRSGSAKRMADPGPNAAQLRQILAAGARVPDHGKLAPWRFIVFEGKARKKAGKLFVEALKETESVSDSREEQERDRLARAPVVVAVVSRVQSGIPIPEWEQVLSAGAVCQNMLIAAHALGFVGNWLTEWCAYHPGVAERLGLKSGERIAGFLYFGSNEKELEERVRPDLDSLITHFEV
ncbi:MAG TPA: nitroreductase [Rhizomicrobium sp.]|jgi:nitroreductase|nr:nitroreductase [Rhizomicrobium sp.]